ncbi:MAG: adenylate/guanylate cyclase domain-containing protein [Acidimicrobiia bacterium]
MTGAEGAVVFTDLVGFTEFTAKSGDDAALHILAVQDEIVRPRLPADARVVKELGDGLMLFFGEPRAAVTAMLDVLDGFAAAADADELPLWVRVGAHGGAPTRRGDDLVGHDANVAARIVDVASPGELLVSDALRCAGDHEHVTFDELGPVMMKGLVEPISLYRAERCRSSEPELTGGTASRR